MTMQDGISDMLTRIRNAQSAKKKAVSMPASTLKTAIAKVLQEEGYIESYSMEDLPNNKKTLHIELKYFKGKAVIEEISRVSKPSLRIYHAVGDLPQVRGGLGIAIVSTSEGVMTARAARQRNQGGEVLCYVA